LLIEAVKSVAGSKRNSLLARLQVELLLTAHRQMNSM
jgi:hypothetical protein